MGPTKKRILCAFGTRPEVIKLVSVIRALKSSDDFEIFVLSTAQHREMLDQMLAVFDIKPDVDLGLMRERQRLNGLLAQVVARTDPVLTSVLPDLVVVQGDTTSALGVAMAAVNSGVRVAHVEAGLRTDEKYNPFPEEVNRRLLTRLADIHFAPTARAREDLLAERVDPASIFETGNTVIDALKSVGTVKSTTLPPLDTARHELLVTMHRREHRVREIRQVCRALKHMVGCRSDVQFLIPVHRNPRVKDVIHEELTGIERIHLVEPLPYTDFVAAMQRCYAILTDSGGVQEEAPALGKPLLVLRRKTERPEVIACGAGRLVGCDTQRIRDELDLLLDDEEHYRSMANAGSPYGDGHAASRIVDAIRSMARE